jgi:hypothetical protein
MMGMTCPAGTACNVRMSGANTIAVCARDGDAGADAGADATATDSGVDTGVDSGVDSGVADASEG